MQPCHCEGLRHCEEQSFEQSRGLLNIWIAQSFAPRNDGAPHNDRVVALIFEADT